MIVDVVNAKTVIAGTPGTVTKLEAGILRIRSSAYTAFMVIELLTLLLLYFS